MEGAMQSTANEHVIEKEVQSLETSNDVRVSQSNGGLLLEFDQAPEFTVAGGTFKVQEQCSDVKFIGNSFMNFANSFSGVMTSNGISVNGDKIRGKGFSIDKVGGKRVVEFDSLDNTQFKVCGLDVTDAIRELCASSTPEASEGKPRRFWLKNSKVLRNVQTAAAAITIEKGVLAQDNSLAVHGSGSIVLDSDSSYNGMSVSVQGSGDVRGCKVQQLMASVQGSGDISGFFVERSANLSVQGSGDINIRKSAWATISKSIQGSGDINVRQ